MERITCQACKTTRRMPEGWTLLGTFVKDADGAWAYDEQGHPLRGHTVKGTYSDKVECGDKCQSATGPACECKCSGHNHGAGAAA